MKLDMNKLSEYDLTNAKVGDKVIIVAPCTRSKWLIKETTIKSISPKRKDITFSNGTKINRYGRKLSASTWDIGYYKYLEATQENVAIVNSYIKAMNEVGNIIQLFGEIERQGYKMLYDLTENRINILSNVMKEIFNDAKEV